MIKKINTIFKHSYLIDYSYKNLKEIEFAKEKEINVCSVIFWKNEERITVIRCLLSFINIFEFVGVKKKQVMLRYNSKNKKVKKGKNFLQVLLPIVDVDKFIYFLLFLGIPKRKYMKKKKEEEMDKKKANISKSYVDERYRKRGIIYIFSMSGYKIRWIYDGKHPLFENYIYMYIYIVSRIDKLSWREKLIKKHKKKRLKKLVEKSLEKEEERIEREKRLNKSLIAWEKLLKDIQEIRKNIKFKEKGS